MPFADELRVALGGRPRVLAWALTDDGVVAGLPDGLAQRTPDGWTITRWDDIDHGRFERESTTLSWSTSDGGTHTAALSDPGRLPELFHERVEASIVAQLPVTWDGGRATLVARRNPGHDDAALRWRVVAAPGTALDAPEADRAIADALRFAIQEWDVA